MGSPSRLGIYRRWHPPLGRVRLDRDVRGKGAAPCPSHSILAHSRFRVSCIGFLEWRRKLTFVAQLPHQLVRIDGPILYHLLDSSLPQSVQSWTRDVAYVAHVQQSSAAVRQVSTSYAGTFLIPNAVFASTASLLAGIYMSRTGYYRRMLVSDSVPCD